MRDFVMWDSACNGFIILGLLVSRPIESMVTGRKQQRGHVVWTQGKKSRQTKNLKDAAERISSQGMTSRR